MENKLRISPGFCFTAALWLLLLPLRWGIGAFLAALVHELFHCLAVYSCGGRVYKVFLEGFGARMETDAMSPLSEGICALAGPAGSFILLIIAESFPEAAICGLIHGTFNLLPIFPLDGGRFLRCIIPKPVCTGIEVFSLTFLSGLCLLISEFTPDFAALCILFLWIPVVRRKISCKETKLAVQ